MSQAEYACYINSLIQRTQKEQLELRSRQRSSYLITEAVKLRARVRDFIQEFNIYELSVVQFELKLIINDNGVHDTDGEEARFKYINSQIRKVEHIRTYVFELLFEQGFIFMPDGSLKPRDLQNATNYRTIKTR